MIETKPFSILTFIQRLRSFYHSFRDGDYLAIRFVRDPGSNLIKLIYGMGNGVEEAKEELYETVDPQQFEEDHGAPFVKPLLESILDAFSIPDYKKDDDEGVEPEVGDVQSQDFFEKSLDLGLTLLVESPYMEFQLTFSGISGGVACTYTLSRTTFKENIQYNNILIQVVYPLASTDSEEDQDEEDYLPETNQN